LRANSPPRRPPAPPDAAAAGGGSRVMTGLLAQQRSGGDVLLCAAVARRQEHRSGAPDLIWVRQHARLRDAVLPRAGALSRNRPDVNLPFQSTAAVTLPALRQGSVATYGASAPAALSQRTVPRDCCCGRMDRPGCEVVLFVANPYAESVLRTVALAAPSHAATAGKVIVLASTTPDDVNSFEGSGNRRSARGESQRRGIGVIVPLSRQFLHRATLKMAQ